MNSLLQKSLAIALLMIAGSISLYYLKIRPEQMTAKEQQDSYIKQQALDLEKQKYEDAQEAKKTNDISLSICLNDAEINYSAFWDRECEALERGKDCRLPAFNVNRIEDSRKTEKDECFKKYSQ